MTAHETPWNFFYFQLNFVNFHSSSLHFRTFVIAVPVRHSDSSKRADPQQRSCAIGFEIAMPTSCRRNSVHTRKVDAPRTAAGNFREFPGISNGQSVKSSLLFATDSVAFLRHAVPHVHKHDVRCVELLYVFFYSSPYKTSEHIHNHLGNTGRHHLPGDFHGVRAVEQISSVLQALPPRSNRAERCSFPFKESGLRRQQSLRRLENLSQGY